MSPLLKGGGPTKLVEGFTAPRGRLIIAPTWLVQTYAGMSCQHLWQRKVTILLSYTGCIAIYNMLLYK